MSNFLDFHLFMRLPIAICQNWAMSFLTLQTPLSAALNVIMEGLLHSIHSPISINISSFARNLESWGEIHLTKRRYLNLIWSPKLIWEREMDSSEA